MTLVLHADAETNLFQSGQSEDFVVNQDSGKEMMLEPSPHRI